MRFRFSFLLQFFFSLLLLLFFLSCHSPGSFFTIEVWLVRLYEEDRSKRFLFIRFCSVLSLNLFYCYLLNALYIRLLLCFVRSRLRLGSRSPFISKVRLVFNVILASFVSFRSFFFMLIFVLSISNSNTIFAREKCFFFSSFAWQP